ncbi:MAG: hypothetical protein MUC92_02505 [Fimbriimonadaceae bacterium]|nr:hypothetical protein [Fimbriimonadaceae bacterium]
MYLEPNPSSDCLLPTLTGKVVAEFDDSEGDKWIVMSLQAPVLLPNTAITEVAIHPLSRMTLQPFLADVRAVANPLLNPKGCLKQSPKVGRYLVRMTDF